MDDLEWFSILERCLKGNIDDHLEQFSMALESSVMRIYHGCRTEDAGIYFRNGLLPHDQAILEQRLEAILARHPELEVFRANFEQRINNIGEIDKGCLYGVIDDTCLLERAAHYLIYGSEWLCAVLREDGRHVLKEIGAPTLLEVDLPLYLASKSDRRELACALFTEWTRQVCNKPTQHHQIDFTFAIHSSIPSSCIVGHRHPKTLIDPLSGYRSYVSPVTYCAYCA
ncbi:MAG: hypothetical protein HQL97_04655 [Magnetococcales bacterium]|nr:hypothetical protein [Magnetococcales bacterium]